MSWLKIQNPKYVTVWSEASMYNFSGATEQAEKNVTSNYFSCVGSAQDK